MNVIKDRCLITEFYCSVNAVSTFTVFMSSVFVYVQVSVDDSKEKEVRRNYVYMLYSSVDDRWLLASRSADCNVTPADIPPGCSPHPSRELPLLFTVL
jgi:hypothetical protein